MEYCSVLDSEPRYSSSIESGYYCVADIGQGMDGNLIFAGLMQALSPETSGDYLELPDWEKDMFLFTDEST
jgi:hypothetical protein